MADGSEKPVKSFRVGEAVLVWNEETKTPFPSRVVSALHDEEKVQTLFDIELEDGRRFTVNNDHPMYVFEDNDFTFTRESAASPPRGVAMAAAGIPPPISTTPTASATITRSLTPTLPGSSCPAARKPRTFMTSTASKLR
jgi:hypothetical protein